MPSASATIATAENHRSLRSRRRANRRSCSMMETPRRTRAASSRLKGMTGQDCPFGRYYADGEKRLTKCPKEVWRGPATPPDRAFGGTTASISAFNRGIAVAIRPGHVETAWFLRHRQSSWIRHCWRDRHLPLADVADLIASAATDCPVPPAKAGQPSMGHRVEEEDRKS